MREFDAYNAFPYAGDVYHQCHVDTLATVGGLMGMVPADPERCRVLEVGCADAANLIGMAMNLPGSVFVGVDGAAVQIGLARGAVEALGLGNVTLQVADLRALGPELGIFDYIIVHGVFSWVAPDAREALLALCRRHLAPQGIAYISYNALPGWHANMLVRRLMMFHTRGCEDTGERLAQARAVVRFVSDAAAGVGASHASLLAAAAAHLEQVDDDYLFHDYLEHNNAPFLLHEFLARARQHDLQYVGDSDLHRMAGAGVSEAARATIESFTDDPIAQEQHLDFLVDRSLRRTLLCHAEVPLRRGIELSDALKLRFASDLREVGGCFQRPGGDRVIPGDPLHLATLRALEAAAPRAVPFAELSATASAAVGDVEPDDLCSLLLRCVLQGVVTAHRFQAPLSAAVPPRPAVRPVVRLQAARGKRLTAQTHRPVVLRSDFEALLVTHLDGRHTLAELTALLLPLVEVASPEVLAEAVHTILVRLAKQGLLLPG